MLILPCLITFFVQACFAIDNHLGRTPIMGVNSWTSFGTSVTAADLQGMGDFLVSSGMAKAGYQFVNLDDGWAWARNATTGQLTADAAKFPQGIPGVVQYLAKINLSFGIYTAESSVVCSGRPGSLYHEVVDVNTFASWGVKLVKNDNCGEYSFGNRRYDVFADAVSELPEGQQMVLSTEPFSLVPNNLVGTFSHYFRTGDDIDASWNTILDRIDRNAKWADLTGPGRFGDPDMLQVGNGDLTLNQQRTHFGLWAISKAPLILGSDVRKLNSDQIAILTNSDVIAVNQDPLGVPAKKLSVNGVVTPRFVGVGSCYQAHSGSEKKGFNAMSSLTYQWLIQNDPSNTSQVQLYHYDSQRCLAVITYMGSLTPVLLPCDSSDLTQMWVFPTGSNRIGGIINAANPGMTLAVSNSTVYGAVHGNDAQALLDAAYGINKLVLAPYKPEKPCFDRNCQGYDPTQSWYYNRRSKLLTLAHAAANGYRCYEGPCYLLTSHLPASDEFCLTSVASISNDPIDPSTTTVPGVDLWGGPLSQNQYVIGVVNRFSVTSAASIGWDILEVPGFGRNASACVKEAFSGKTLGLYIGGMTLNVSAFDMALLLLKPNVASC
eukprot:PhF_6_TR30577/c0_g2_i1/m.44953/K07407/E3.2.1.22B, galA, rafA; alpha-galactosidase